ncbi:MAG: hypothetical protein WC897_02170 [Candidatus Gracilibacteria bacterium]
MNNNSKTHGMVDSNGFRPKSKDWKRRNKTKARITSVARQTALKEALAKGN